MPSGTAWSFTNTIAMPLPAAAAAASALSPFTREYANRKLAGAVAGVVSVIWMA